MQIEVLRYFTELARAKSFYSASKRLFISQQGLNKAITALESELGAKLIDRTRRGIRLTNAGEAFLVHAEALLEEYARMLDALYAENRYIEPESSHLVFHVTHYTAQVSHPFANAVKSVETMKVSEEPFSQIIEEATNNDGSELFCINAFPRTLQTLQAQSDMIFEPILSSQFGLVWADGSPLANARAIHREQLRNHPLAVGSHRETMHLLDYVMEDYPLNNIRMSITQLRSILEYISRNGDAAATLDSLGFMLAERSPQFNTDGLHFTPFSTPRSKFQVGFIYARNAKPNVRARHIIERLKRFITQAYPEYIEKHPIEA